MALTTNSTRSVTADLDDAAYPDGWYAWRNRRWTARDSTIYELHIRDFSIGDTTCRPLTAAPTWRSPTEGAGMRHLRSWPGRAEHGAPVARVRHRNIEEDRAEQQTPACDLRRFPPDGEEQQACVTAVADTDGFNWGYDPLHYTTPEGSYATDPEGAQRTREFRRMVGALNRSGPARRDGRRLQPHGGVRAGPTSILDRIVPATTSDSTRTARSRRRPAAPTPRPSTR